jgi:hypothetical protein
MHTVVPARCSVMLTRRVVDLEATVPCVLESNTYILVGCSRALFYHIPDSAPVLRCLHIARAECWCVKLCAANMHSVHTQRASFSVQATYGARNAGRLRAVRPGLQAGRAAGGKGTAAQPATEQQRVPINNEPVERDVPVSEPWIPRAWLSPNTAVLLRQLQVAASALLQQRLQGHSTSPPTGQLTGPSQRLLQPDHEALVNQLGARLQHQAPAGAAAAGQDPLVSALQQIR